MEASHTAAQYIRMSTDRQDLSLATQKRLIAAFAAANDLEIVETYEDDARSGLRFENRPGMQRLIADVKRHVGFRFILVYDVSRWGRTQDPDEAAYYEFKCRKHGVNVIYIAQGVTEHTLNTAYEKAGLRLDAARYSRDLGVKSRAGQQQALSMGYQMGPLPALGYRRCSVSSDGKRSAMLAAGQRKSALTDRVKWVLAPDAEVDLVRRICDAYARTRLDLWEIASLVSQQGWRTTRNSPITENSLRQLLRNEALVGNFLWGISEQNWKRRIVGTPPTRVEQSVPRIIDDATWELIQERLWKSTWLRGIAREFGNDDHESKFRRPIASTYCFGGIEVAHMAHRRRATSRRRVAGHRSEQSRELGEALAQAIDSTGVPTTFSGRTYLLSTWNARVRIKLLWRREDDCWGDVRDFQYRQADYLLLVRMKAEYLPLDFFLVPPRTTGLMVPRRVQDPLPASIERCRCSTPLGLLRRLAEIRCEGGGLLRIQRDGR